MKFAAYCMAFATTLLFACGDGTGKMFSEVDHDDSGIEFRNLLVEDKDLNVAHYIYFYNGAGVAIGDVNNDGLQDVFFTGNMVKNRLYVNKGNFEFENITDESGVAEMQGWCSGASMVDINHDGYQDIYICRSADDDPARRKNLLFINNKNLTFSEQAERYGLADNGYSTQATFFDYDKDGDLDCFVLNHSVSEYSTGVTENPEMRNKKLPDYASRLYRNDNDHFSDVSDSAGITSNVLSFGLGVATADFNNDGWTDIYVSNDFKESDYLFLNNRNGTFTESAEKCMDVASLNSMGSDAADYNNDGFVDLVTLDMLSEDNYLQKTHAGPNAFDKSSYLISKGFQPQYMRNMLQKNNGDGTFSEVGQMAGVSNTDWSWSALLCDFDGDMKKDLYISNGFVKDFSDLDFMAYSTDKLIKKRKGEDPGTFEETIEKMPTIKLSDYMFHNDSAGTFRNVTKEWGLATPAIGSGAAYADLDNDGDMDIIVNNSNQFAGVYKNNSREREKNNYIRVKFEGSEKNTNGIGARVNVYCNGEKMVQEQYPVRGYQSSVDMVLNFGLGKAAKIDSIRVLWAGEKTQFLRDVQVNQTLILKESEAVTIDVRDSVANEKTMLRTSTAFGMHHTENRFNDFTVQPLLLNYLSRQGPCMAKADVNKDGLEDIFIGGAKESAGQLYVQNAVGSFSLTRQADIAADSAREDVAAVFFDADNDGDIDLLVGSGGYEFDAEDPLLESRLYLNNGRGLFAKAKDALPDAHISTGCIKTADVDGDGDQDIFMGGRVIPGKYPLAPETKILVNDGHGHFSDGTAAIAPVLKNIGMVTDALWTDLNKDGRDDLIVVGEWMPIKVFLNKGGKLEDASIQYIPFASVGWWNKILADDFDGDGDMDLIVGNAGTNLQFRASEKEPVSLYYKDFDGNGSIDPIFCFFIQGVSYPSASRDDLLEQLPLLKKKFNSYATYATATISDVFTAEQLKDAKILNANILSTVYLEKKGGSFSVKSLPAEVQSAPVHVMQTIDVNMDGKKDVIIAGNNAWTRVRFGRHRSNHGIVLIGDGKGNFTYVPQYKSGLNIRGDVRSLEILNAKESKKLFFGVNDSGVMVYDVNN